MEGLYGAICYYVPEIQGSKRKRWSIILRTFRACFDLDRITGLQQRMEALFELCDGAAHPWEFVRPTKLYAEAEAQTSYEVATYTPDAAKTNIDLAMAVIDNCTLYPLSDVPEAERWAKQNRSAFEVMRTERIRTASS